MMSAALSWSRRWSAVRGPMIAAVTAGRGTREQLTGAVEEFRRAGIVQGVIREDVSSPDILLALAGVTLVAGAGHQRPQAERLLDLLMDGITRPDPWRRRTEPSAR
jgi:hypothetical protein